MANRTITAPSSTYAGTIAGIEFSGGTATADDTTAAGKALIAFATRRGWGVSGGPAAVTPSVDEGKPIARWTNDELREYLDAHRVTYPSGAVKADLLAAALDAFETKAQGGSAANQSAGHIMGTIPPEGAPVVPGDDEAKAAGWITPQTADTTGDEGAGITGEPDDVSVVAPAPASFAVVVSGSPTPDVQWQRGDGEGWVDIEGATGTEYEIDPTDVGMTGDTFRAVVSNRGGTATSATATLTVTAE